MDISGTAFVVTGGGNGIGREVVRALAAAGARVAALDLNEDGLAETHTLAGSSDAVSTHVVDVTDRESVARAVAEAVERHGAIDGLVNVAGIIQRFVPVLDLEMPEMERVMNVNFWGTVNMVKALLPHLLSRPHAAIVNVSSMGALAPVPGQAVYGASKAAVALLTQGLHAELLDSNVAVTLVYPGGVATNITGNSGVGTPSATSGSSYTLTSPEDAAARIVTGIERGSVRVLIGKDARGLDTLARLSPRRATHMIAKKMAQLRG